MFTIPFEVAFNHCSYYWPFQMKKHFIQIYSTLPNPSRLNLLRTEFTPWDPLSQGLEIIEGLGRCLEKR